MPNYPKESTPAEVWANADRTITALTGQPRTDLVGQDNSLEATTGTRIAKVDNVDAAVSTRALEAGGNIAAVKTKTDNLPVNPAAQTNLDVAISSRAAIADYSAARALKLDNLDANVSTRALEAGGRLDSIPAFLTPTETPVIMDGTEKTLVEVTDVKAGEIEAWVDLTPMAGVDSILIRYSRKLKAAGTYAKYAEETYTGAQTIPALCILNKKIYRDTKVTAQQTVGTNRTLDVQVIRTRTA